MSDDSPDRSPDELSVLGPEVVTEVQVALQAAMMNRDALDQDHLSNALSALIGRIHALAWTPERAVTVVKRILKDSFIQPSPYPHAEASQADRATVVYQRAILISIEAYYRLGAPPPT